ncbi:MAG: hypothetical protein NTX17_01495 [Candidatus Eisenbacteria bacterium]|nr:hypothetical protein [Candidatus Eisenbacteria bacterium]
MKAFAISIALICLCYPTLVIAEGNLHPQPVLIMRNSEVNEAPADVCTFRGENPEAPMQCYAEKLTAGNFGFLSVHVGLAPNGFTGVAFGIRANGSPVTFLGFVPCPGFSIVVSNPGIPSAIMVTSSTGCRASWEAVGYLEYVCSGTGPTYFDIVPNADFPDFKVVNCDYTFDLSILGVGAQWGGMQELECVYGWDSIESTTWGKVKAMFR